MLFKTVPIIYSHVENFFIRYDMRQDTTLILAL